MSYVKTVVKVGQSSKLQLRNTKLYRAITIDELKGLCKKLNAEVVIIEYISDDEYAEASEFLRSYVESGHKVYFFTPDNDENTEGLADELNLEIASSNADICNIIEAQCGWNFRTDISIPTEKYDSDDALDFDSSIDLGLVDATDILIEMPDVISKNTFDSSDLGIEEDEEPALEAGGVTEEVSEDNIENNADSNIVEVPDTKTLEELNTAKNRIAELYKVIKSVKDERDTYKAELAAIEVADIITDAFTIEEHTELKAKVTELESQAGNVSNVSSEELEQAREELTRLNNENSELELKVSNLQRRVDEAESNRDDSKIAELSSTIEELNSEISRISTECEDYKGRIEKLNAEKEDMEDALKAEKTIKTQTNAMLLATIAKAGTVVILENELNKARKDNEGLISRLGMTSASLNDITNKFNALQDSFDAKLSQARELIGDELASAKKENSGLISKLSITTSELENQKRIYNDLIMAAGGDELGVRNLASQNTYLQEIVNSLREKVTELQNEKDAAVEDKKEVEMKLAEMRSRNDTITKQLSMSSGNYYGVPTNGLIHPISYTSGAKIILVTGTGSYGVTTTALSIASKLAADARVTYIDFDLVSAKADSWFMTNPLVTGIGGLNPKAEYNSGMGLLVDKGIGFFIPYAKDIIKYCDLGGNKVNYISGFYASPDQNKLVSTNFEQFINFCGGSSDYVVIDFGRLGVTDIGNNILRAFSKIAMKTVVVSTNDKFDIRNARMKLKSIGIQIEKVAWLINLTEDTKLDDSIKKIITPANYFIMTFADDFYGQKKLFMANRGARAKFERFLSENILGRVK